MTYFRCLFQRIPHSSSDKSFWILSFKKIRGQVICRGSRLPLYTITCVFVYNVLQWRYMKLKENIMDFLDKEQLIVVIICGILIIIGISI